MIGYTCVGTNNLDKAVSFYEELLGLLGAKPFFKTDRGIGWGVSPDKPMFSVLQPFDGQPATVGNGTMVAFSVANPQEVQAFYAKALALGASGVLLGRATLYGAMAEGEPGAIRALDILREELQRTLQLCGAADLKQLNAELLVPSDR